MFNKILIANRGEIACRIVRTARRLGYRTVAVYSDADPHSPHVRLADEAHRIGPGPAAQSYLSSAALLAAAHASGADAVHPGYGFLSERADFAQACIDAGLVFIGPPPAAIDAMGDKAGAKRRMLAAGVPCAPGCTGDDATLLASAADVGYPLLVKAVAGGGGRGMRLVHKASELPAAITSARREAESAFGDGTLMLERLITRGRHIEIQVFADSHGNALHLSERDCTAQRRRQKVIEEAPSPIVTPELRERMGRDAVAAALAVGYRGAGTVEFIVDAELRHYFLEMNTRLQVEHPVTECITGLDLVEWQLRVASGEKLPLQQSEIRFEGHAIEARLYAEDPYQGFVPQTGRILHWQPQRAIDAGARIDAGIAEGGEVGPFYDAMVAKLIVHGRDRTDATRRLAAALEASPLLGLKTNGRFLRDLLRHKAFTEARMHTTLIDEWATSGEPLLTAPLPDDDAWRIAAAALALHGGPGQPRPAGVASWGMTLRHEGHTRSLRVALNGHTAQVTLDEQTIGVRRVDRHGATQHWQIGERTIAVIALIAPPHAHLVIDAAVFAFGEPSPIPQAERTDDPRRAVAPVAGVVAQMLVKAGDKVAAGQQLASVEAMKMEMWLTAAQDGTVRAVHAAPMDTVTAGTLLVEMEIAT